MGHFSFCKDMNKKLTNHKKESNIVQVSINENRLKIENNYIKCIYKLNVDK